MLTGEIKLYEETYTYQSTTTTTGVKAYKYMSKAEQAEFELKVDAALLKARSYFKIGDSCGLKTSPNRHMVITGFIDDPEDVMWYQGELCVLYAREKAYISAQPIRYSIGEFDLKTIQTIVDTPIEVPQDAQ